YLCHDRVCVSFHQSDEHSHNPLEMSLPGRICSGVNFALATSTSTPAAHSSADRWVISKKRQRSWGAYLPFPSAIFSGIEVDARLAQSQRNVISRRGKPCAVLVWIVDYEVE